MKRKGRRQVYRQAGFTLIEVLVSLMIFSTAILGLIHANTENLRSLKALEKKQIAGIIADNRLLLASLSNKKLIFGRNEDDMQMDGFDWHVSLRTEKTTQPGLYRLIVQVSQRASKQIIVERTAFASDPQPQPQPPLFPPGGKR